MKNNYVSTNISIYRVFLLITRYFLVFIIFYILSSVLVLVSSGGELYQMLLSYSVVFWGGLIASTLIHEYGHIYFFKKFGVEKVIIKRTIFMFRIVPEKQLYGKELMITALIGPLSCGGIGLVLYVIELLGYTNLTITLVKLIYSIHLINLLPFFGDGKCILKSIISN